MASASLRALRIPAAVPFIFLAIGCLRALDVEALVAHQQPFIKAMRIDWDGGSIPILPNFHRVAFLDELWCGTTATFSPSTLGYDSIGWWQMFTFLQDLGPIYAIWILESSRQGYAWTPAYFPTIFATAGQLLGLGTAGSLFYFVIWSFGPRASDLSRSLNGRRLRTEYSAFLLPVMLVFHSAQVFAMFASPDFTTRHFWTWAWQMAPLWIGISNCLLGQVAKLLSWKDTRTGSPFVVPSVLSVISGGTWLYMLAYSPYSLASTFMPPIAPETDFISHARAAFQGDELYVFASAFLWIVYQFYDLHVAGLSSGTDWIYPILSLPVLTLCLGPGAALAISWYQKEKILSRKSRV